MDEPKPRVFVVDDDDSVRKSLSRLLRSTGFDNEVFESADAFLRRERYAGIGCIILDIRMPGLSGMDLQDELGKMGYSIPVIFITGHGSIPMGVQAMKKGAADFLAKPFDDLQLLEAVTNAIEKHKEAKKESDERKTVLDRLAGLTRRETEVLWCVVEGLLNKQIAFKLGIAEKTVKVHRGRVMEKLHAQSVADLVRMTGKVDSVSSAN
jgi:FixJ family two-component response regulator